MLPRVTALLLAVLLLWSSLGTMEGPLRLAQTSPGQPYATSPAQGAAGVQPGSVEHHHLDDLPSQAQSEPSTDTPGLPPTAAQRQITQATVHPLAALASAGGWPGLAVPLRPPSPAHGAG